MGGIATGGSLDGHFKERLGCIAIGGSLDGHFEGSIATGGNLDGHFEWRLRGTTGATVQTRTLIRGHA